MPKRLMQTGRFNFGVRVKSCFLPEGQALNGNDAVENPLALIPAFSPREKENISGSGMEFTV